MPIFLLVVVAATAVARGSLLCPATCTATVDGSSWPCRYYQNDCKVNITSLDPSRVVDLNVAVINPYVGGLGDLMSQVEPAIAMAVQDIEDSSFLPGYRLNAHLADSKCSVPEATRAAVAAMTTGVTKHVVLSDSCSAACEAVNDALRHFNVLQVGPGCISVTLSDSERYPYFTRMAPSFRFNVISLYDLFRYLGFHRVGTIYGYRSINNLAKDLFVEMMASDNAAGNYSWTHLYSHRVEFIEDATAAVEKAASKDSRINFVALYEAEGSMLLCQAYKKNLLTPDFNWFVAAGWWNQNYILLNANTANSPCTADELHRASYGIIASDRGPMLNTPQFHSLSGRRLDDLYSEYTNECESFANGKGVCNYQWAGYFYDGMWLIASVLHSFLINQNRSINEFGTEQSVQSLNALSEQVDFNGQTGRVRQFNAVNPKTTPPSYGDRDGIVLLRQATGPPESAFVHLAFRTEDGLDFKTSIKWSSTEPTKMVACSGATCDFANGWVPSDRTDACPAGQVWSLQEGCLPCSRGHFASLGMSQCEACAPGRFSSTDGAAACSPCTPGTFAMVQRSSNCHDCPEGTYSESVEATQCQRCPIGTYAASKGLQQCTSCPQDRETAFEGATSEDMCVCSFGQRLEGGSCILCDVTEICDGSRVIGHRPNNQQWLTTLDVAGRQRALSQMIAKEFFLIALKIEKDDQQLNSVMSLFSSTLTAMMNGDEGLNIIAAPDQAVTAALELVMDVWVLLKPVLVDQTSKMLNAVDVDLTTVGQVAEQTTALRTASQGVVDALTDAASSAGAQLNGLLVDIAGRQRMLIQELCKDALIVALGASVVTTKASLQRVATLFETTHDGLIFGISAVGIPELRKVCSMHQMQEVSYYYRQVRPYLREITNGRTSVESSMIAVRVAPSINSLTTPLFQAMVAAVRLFINDTGTCEALGTISESELMALTDGIAVARLGLADAIRHYMQVAIRVVVKESRVELSVIAAAQSQRFRDLVQGQKLQNMPAPPTQQMLETFIEMMNHWETFAFGLTEAVQTEQPLPEVDVSQQIILNDALMEEMNHAMELQAEVGATFGSASEIKFLNLMRMQSVRFHLIPSKAFEVTYGGTGLLPIQKIQEELNLTIWRFRSVHEKLLMGAPATPDNIALRQITDLCIIREMAQVMELYHTMESACFDIIGGSLDAITPIDISSHDGIDAMEEAAIHIIDFYRGQAISCANVTYGRAEWEELMSEITRLAGYAQDVSSDFIRFESTGVAYSLNSSMTLLDNSFGHLVMGYPGVPHVPVQQKQAYLDRVLNRLQPAVQSFKTATLPSSPYATARAELGKIYVEAQDLLQAYTEQAAIEDWPARRVSMAMWQSVLAKRIYTESTAQRFDRPSELEIAETEFQTALQELKDGGGSFPAIISERQDLLDQWGRIDSAWSTFRSSKGADDLAKLLGALEASLPLFSIKDVESAPGAPWIFIGYGALGFMLLIYTCGACFVARAASQKRSNANLQPSAV